MFSLSVILFGVDVYILNSPTNISSYKPIKQIQADVPYKNKSKIRKLYEKGGKDFRLYYENKWYKPYSQNIRNYNDEVVAKLRAKHSAYKVLREEDYKRYGCEEEAEWHKYKYYVDYFASLTSQFESITTTEECRIFLKANKKYKKTIDLF